MKKLLLLLGIIVLLVKTENLFSQCLTVNAGSDQSMCSGPANLSMTYTPVYATTSYTVAPITYAPASYTGGSLALATNVDDIYSGVINIGFCFQFYGNTYTQCIVGSNGLISFDLTEASDYCNWSISSTNQLPNTSVPMNSIMGPYHDIDPSVNPSSGTSEVKYATYGSAPCRTFVVSWSNTPMFSCNSMIDNQQIILYESTNIIEVHMGNKPLCNSWNGGLAILGIQNSSGTVATAVSGKNCTQWSATNESYRFSPAGTEVTTVNWLEGVTVLSNSTSTSVNPSSTTTYTAQLTTPTCAGNIVVTDDVEVTITPGVAPTFAAIPNVCIGDAAPTLPTTSTNGITGTWSPVVSTAVAGTTTYTFTPTAGQCASTTTTTITVNASTVPTFAVIPSVCQNDAAPILPTTSTNGITGTWSPAVNTSTVGTTTYTFTPTAGQCASVVTTTITVDAPTVPTFTAIPNICQNDPAPLLPTSSTDIPAITGTWLPSVSTGTTGITVYTFTPTSGQCAVTTTNTIMVDTPVTPSFAVVPSVCQNSAAPVLPTSSTDIPAIIGSWLPAVSTSAAGTTIYTFTPSAGQCAVNTTTAITVDPQITPTFTPVSDVCLNAVTPILSTGSTNSPAITGTWSPAVSTSTAGTTTYTFTPSVGECATTTTTTILVTSQIIPTFTQIANMCQGSVPPALPSVSTNSPAMTGVWFPATISTAAAGTTTYTFTPDPGQCGTTTTMDITINAQVTPTFASISNICQNSAVPILPTSSTNSPAILGTWSPTVSTSTAGTTTYTFTPSAGQCATTTTNTITIDSQVTPTFTSIPNICQNSVAPPLPTNSTNTPAITGTWSSAINTAVAGTNVYTFSPSAGECAATATMSVTIDPLITPIFAAIPNVCQNSVAPVLPATSTNSITGVWSPTVNTTLAGTVTYTFTPTTGGCSTTATNTITVDPQITPLFTAITPICAGTVAPTLPTNSNNSPIISGTWLPATVNNISSGTYTFTPSAGECATTTTLTVTVNPLPIVFVVDPAPVCEPLTIDLTDPSLTAGSSGGTIGYYNDTNCTIPISSPSIIVGSGTYYIGSVSSVGCLTSMPINVIINALPVASFTPNPQSLNAYNLTSVMENTSIGASNYEWYFMDGTESNTSDPSHTFPDSIYGEQLVILIAISPEGCRDTTEKAVTIIEELIFYVPNSFTPDGDKFNQTFQPVFTSGYDPFDFTMLIFNRWGEIVFESHDASSGWDGTYGDRLIKDDVLTWKIEFKITENDKRISATGSVTIAK